VELQIAGRAISALTRDTSESGGIRDAEPDQVAQHSGITQFPSVLGTPRVLLRVRRHRGLRALQASLALAQLSAQTGRATLVNIAPSTDRYRAI